MSGCGRIAHDVDNGDVFRVRACESIDGREFTNAKGGDDGGDAFYSCLSVGGIA